MSLPCRRWLCSCALQTGSHNWFLCEVICVPLVKYVLPPTPWWTFPRHWRTGALAQKCRTVENTASKFALERCLRPRKPMISKFKYFTRHYGSERSGKKSYWIWTEFYWDHDFCVFCYAKCTKISAFHSYAFPYRCLSASLCSLFDRSVGKTSFRNKTIPCYRRNRSKSWDFPWLWKGKFRILWSGKSANFREFCKALTRVFQSCALKILVWRCCLARFL